LSRGFDSLSSHHLKAPHCNNFVTKLPSTCGPGEQNGHWKGGISKDKYRYKRLQRERYPERVNAREKVRKAIKSGKLVRMPCQHPGCASAEGTHAHHSDYSRPLDVTWLCSQHHKEADTAMRGGPTRMSKTNFPPTPCGTNHQPSQGETGRDRG
jgi:hypothetical protein